MANTRGTTVVHVELPVSVFVLIVGAATLAGGLVGATLIIWRDRRPMELYRQTLESLRSAEVKNKAATDQIDSLRSDLSHVTEQLDAANHREAIRGTQANVAVQQLSSYKTRFDDIIGLETEIASLRVVAGRVPGLERRIAELEPNIIDLRERRHELSD